MNENHEEFSPTPIAKAIREAETTAIINAAIEATRNVAFERMGGWPPYHCAACALLHLSQEVLSRRILSFFTDEDRARAHPSILEKIVKSLPTPLLWGQAVEIVKNPGVVWGDWPFTVEQMEESLKQPQTGVNVSDFDLLGQMLKDAKEHMLEQFGGNPFGGVGIPVQASEALGLLQALGIIGSPAGEEPKKKGKKGKKNG